MTPAPDAGLDGMGRAPGKQRAPSRRTGTAMAAEAATFALASAAHLAASFTDAAVPELLIAAVLGLGSSAVLSQRPHAWGAAAGTTSFATLGTIVGLTIIATGRQDTPDLAYHATTLAALAATSAALWRRRDAAVRPTAQNQRVSNDGISRLLPPCGHRVSADSATYDKERIRRMTQPHAVWPAAGLTVSALTVSGSAVKPPPNSQLMSSPGRATLR